MSGPGDTVRNVERAPAGPGLQPGQLPAIIGLAVGAASMWVVWWLLGPVGMLLGLVAMRRGEPRGKWVIVVAAVAMVLGLVITLLPDDFVTS